MLKFHKQISKSPCQKLIGGVKCYHVGFLFLLKTKHGKNKKYKEVYPSVKPQEVTVKNLTSASNKRYDLSPNRVMFKGVKLNDEARKQQNKTAGKPPAQKK